MSVQQMIQDQTDGLAVLRKLLETKKEDVIAVHEENRRQIGLTDIEIAKAAEARTKIAEHAKVLEALTVENSTHETNKAELAAREETLRKAKIAHDILVAEHTAEHTADLNSLVEQKKLFAEEVKAQEEKQRKANEGFQSQVKEFGKEKERVVEREQDAKNAEQAANALKAKYEKKYADIIRQD